MKKDCNLKNKYFGHNLRNTMILHVRQFGIFYVYFAKYSQLNRLELL